jgi:hypothetical protein
MGQMCAADMRRVTSICLTLKLKLTPFNTHRSLQQSKLQLAYSLNARPHSDSGFDGHVPAEPAVKSTSQGLVELVQLCPESQERV